MNALTDPGAIRAARYIGERVPRKEDGRLLTGKGTFVDDVVLQGMLHVAFVRSPIARGTIRSIDTSVARTMPGVEAVLTQQDLDAVPCTLLSFFLVPTELPVPLLARDYVCYAGDPVVMVIAKDRYLAEDAASMVVVDYEEQDPVVTLADARRAGPIHPGTESNCSQAMGLEEDEDMEEALAKAPYVLTRTIKHARISQSPMETRGCVATRQGADELLVYMTCQSPHMIQRVLQQSFKCLDGMSVRVIAKDVGGSFGLKNSPWREEMATVAAALLLDRPIKWIEDRWENLVGANQAREQEMTTRIAFEKDGTLIAAHSDYHSNNGAYPQGADANVAVHMFMWAAYKMPQPGFYTRGWYTNTVGLAAYRGPWAMESLARETMLDQAARELGIDPVEIRRKNLVRLSDQPTTTPMGIPLEDITPAECLDKLLETFDVAAFRKEQAEARRQGRYLGLGIAAYVEPTGSAGSMAVMTGELAQVRIEPTGKVSALMSTHSQGHGTQTTMAQVIADQLGVSYDDVTVFEGDSSRGGFGPGAAGSRQGVIGGGASKIAAGMLRDKVKSLAAHLLNANEEAITLADGMVHVAGSEEMSRSLAEIAAIAYGEPGRLPPGMEAGLEAQYRYQPPPMTMTSAAHACVVEVDTDTGLVKILRWICSEDCGVVINPAVVEGQVAGGLTQAIGTVLLEAFHYDARGNPTTVTYKDYLLPAISDVPDFEYIHANTPANNPVGSRGVGEGGAIIGPPTLFNAIADALSPFGDVPIDLPLTPTKILSIVEGRDMGGGGHDSIAPTAAASAEQAEHPPEPPDAAATQEPGTSAVLAGLDESVGAEVRLDGTWAIVLATPMGDQAMTGRFRTEGEAVTGALESPEGWQDFTGTIAGDRLKFDLKVAKPMPMTLKYDITVAGDSMTGKVKLGMFGTAKLTGERTG